MSGRLQGKFALVTGAGQGLGEAIAVRFAQEGPAGVVVAWVTAEVRNAAGERIPQYDFRQADSELHPGLNAGLGVDRLVSLGRLGVGVHARWHGVIAGGIADFVTISVGLALD